MSMRYSEAAVGDVFMGCHNLDLYLILCFPVFSNQVKRKDGIIANMMEQLSEAEKQRELAFSKHLSILDGLMNTHRTRMKV